MANLVKLSFHSDQEVKLFPFPTRVSEHFFTVSSGSGISSIFMWCTKFYQIKKSNIPCMPALFFGIVSIYIVWNMYRLNYILVYLSVKNHIYSSTAFT
jgi:hypothetical protein